MVQVVYVKDVITDQGDGYQTASVNLARKGPNPISGVVLLSYTSDQPHEPTLSETEDIIKKRERIDSLHWEMYSKLNLLQIKEEFKQRRNKYKRCRRHHNCYCLNQKEIRKCLRLVTLSKEGRILTNPSHNQNRVKLTLSKKFSLFYL